MDFHNTIPDSLLDPLRTIDQQLTPVLSEVVAAGAADNIQYATVAVTSAEILALNAAPKALVAAPGAGFVLELVSAVFILDYNTTAYATNGILSVRETDAAGAALSATVLLAPFLAQVADTILPVQPLATGLALTANTPMVLSIATAETITGDSPMSVRVAYRVHATGL